MKYCLRSSGAEAEWLWRRPHHEGTTEIPDVWQIGTPQFLKRPPHPAPRQRSGESPVSLATSPALRGARGYFWMDPPPVAAAGDDGLGVIGPIASRKLAVLRGVL